jgi:two-component system LytT family response regulator
VLKQEEISYFEADGDYVKVHSNEKSYLIRRTVRELEKELDPSIFQRIHRSFIINLDFVKVLRPHMNGEYFITLDNNTEIKTSRTYREVIKSYFK